MKSNKTFYIALGSNKGDKHKNLQNAINAIHARIATVTSISKLYKTPALGFDSAHFLNCCITLQTSLAPEYVLEMLLQIETDLGRTRTQTDVYEARVIDLDVILVDNAIINTKTLQVPHPEMHKRKFVLQPLCDIAQHVLHPAFKVDVQQLLLQCEDVSEIESTTLELKNPIQNYSFNAFKYMAIEGNIGAGKTSLATLIGQDFNAELILERFADNPFLTKFYNDAERYAFPLEMAFLADRYQQATAHLKDTLDASLMISDYDISKSLVFSKITLDEDEFNLYKTVFHTMFKTVVKPDLYVFLKQDTERLLENIKTRGRVYEQSISKTYLDKISRGYQDFLKTQDTKRVKIIDVTDKDFVNNRADYLSILEAIQA